MITSPHGFFYTKCEYNDPTMGTVYRTNYNSILIVMIKSIENLAANVIHDPHSDITLHIFIQTVMLFT